MPWESAGTQQAHEGEAGEMWELPEEAQGQRPSLPPRQLLCSSEGLGPWGECPELCSTLRWALPWGQPRLGGSAGQVLSQQILKSTLTEIPPTGQGPLLLCFTLNDFLKTQLAQPLLVHPVLQASTVLLASAGLAAEDSVGSSLCRGVPYWMQLS